MKKKILLFGPKLTDEEKAYGGGTGGYTRKMNLYLNFFRSAAFEMIPCYHSIRGENIPLGFVGRFFVDLWQFWKDASKEKPAILHILGQYRAATPREFVLVILAMLRGIPYLYEIKAGVFVNWYKNTNLLNRWMINFVLKNASEVLGQGQPYIDFIEERLNIKGVYYPNFVPQNEILPFDATKLEKPTIRVLFVGFAYKDKGVFELVEACNQVASDFPIHLTMVGKETDTFNKWANDFSVHPQFTFTRLGRLSHDRVLEVCQDQDIYCYPTRHKGEGHNNTINEAMMTGLTVVTTRQGFLGSIIGKDRGYLLDEVSVEQIIKALRFINANRADAKEKARNARKHLETNFVDIVAFKKLENSYEKILQ